MGVHAWGQNEIDLTTAHGLLTATATAPYQALIEIDYVANAFEVDEMKHYVGFNNILSFNNIHHTHAARVTAVQRYPDGGHNWVSPAHRRVRCTPMVVHRTFG